MGCSASTANSTVNPRSGSSSSSPGNNNPPRNSFQPANAAVASASGNNRSHGNRAVPALVSRPLTKTKNYRHGAPITQGDLMTQRAEYWSTRVEGNPHMWQAIQSSAEALLADDDALANAILEASNITTPNGSLEVCYDERGVQYKVPQYCYANPIELQEKKKSGATEEGEKTHKSQFASSLPHLSGEVIKLRVRINPGDHNLHLEADLALTILELKQLIAEKATEIGGNIPSFDYERERIIFMGKEMMNKTKIGDAGFDDAKVVQVFLRPNKK